MSINVLLEPTATLTGLVCVWLNAKENVWGWVWGIVSVGLYAFIFWEQKLYADAGLQVVFAVSSVYGLWAWTRGGIEKEQHPVRTGKVREWTILSVLGIATSWGLGFYLARYTQDPRPWLDAVLTAGSLVAQYQLARKRPENWLMWILVDVVYVYLYYTQALYWTAFLYAAYLGIAVWGYWVWKRSETAAASGTRSRIDISNRASTASVE